MPFTHKKIVELTTYFFFVRMNKLQEAVDVFTCCMDNNQFFLDGIIARGNVYMDFGNRDGIKFAKYVLYSDIRFISYVMQINRYTIDTFVCKII